MRWNTQLIYTMWYWYSSNQTKKKRKKGKSKQIDKEIKVYEINPDMLKHNNNIKKNKVYICKIKTRPDQTQTPEP